MSRASDDIGVLNHRKRVMTAIVIALSQPISLSSDLRYAVGGQRLCVLSYRARSPESSLEGCRRCDIWSKHVSSGRFGHLTIHALSRL